MRERTYSYAYYPYAAYPYYGWGCDPFDPFCYQAAPGYVIVHGSHYGGENRTVVHPHR